MSSSRLRLCAITTALAVALLCTESDAQLIPQREVELVIAYSQDLKLDQALVDRILRDASAVLQKQDSASDTACPVSLKRTAVLSAVKPSDLPVVIDGPDDMERLRDVSGDVKVVREINWCGEYGKFLGCAGPQKGLMAIVPLDDDTSDGILWAHEFGHYRGVNHAMSSAARQLMLPHIGKDHREINQAECKKIAALPLPVFGLKQKLDRRILVQPALPDPAAQAQSPLPPVQEFMRRHWAHGTPYADIARYEPAVVPSLIAMLEDQRDRPFWSNVVIAIGLLGNRDHAPALIAFFRRGEGTLSASESRAKSSTLLALGFLQNRSPSDAAFNFLVANSNPNAVTVAWQQLGQPDSQRRNREIARSAAVGLAYSGSPAAGTRLAAIQNSIRAGAFSLNTSTGEPEGMISDLRSIHESVNKQGLQLHLRSIQTQKPNETLFKKDTPFKNDAIFKNDTLFKGDRR